MKILIACEFTGIVRDAFINKGHEAISCDIVQSETQGPHVQGNVLEILQEGWDMMIAFPPCTHLAVSGAAWFKDKEQKQKEALNFVRTLMEAPIPRICIENPVSVISTRIRKPDQIINPWMFGDEYSKRTCLWLKNLPLLEPTKIVDRGKYKRYKKRVEVAGFMIRVKGKRIAEWTGKMGGRDGKKRSRTFPGIAKAMADQWGVLTF